MKPFSMAALLLLLFFVSAAQGIRLENGFFKSVDQGKKIHVNVDESSLTRKSNGGDVGYDLCEDEHCSGKSRKLVTVSSSFSSTAISKSESGGRRKEERVKEDGGEEESLISKSWPTTSAGNGQPDTSHDHYYPDMVEITEMDYSPARKKPPIHN